MSARSVIARSVIARSMNARLMGLITHPNLLQAAPLREHLGYRYGWTPMITCEKQVTIGFGGLSWPSLDESETAELL